MHAPTCGATLTNGCRFAFADARNVGNEDDMVFPYPYDKGSFSINNQTAGDATAAVVTVNNVDSGYAGEGGDTAKGGYVLGDVDALGDGYLYVPLFKNDFGGHTTRLVLQYADNPNYTATASVTFYPRSGASKTTSVTVRPDEVSIVLPGDAGVPSCNGGFADTCVGTIIISSARDILGYSMEYDTDADATGYVGVSRAITMDEDGNEAFLPSMKNDYYGGGTGAAVMNPSTSSHTYDLDFVVTGTEGSCSASVGDTASDTVAVSAHKHAIVSYGKGNVGGLPNCVYYTMKVSGTIPVVVSVNESQNSGSRLAQYNSLAEGSAEFLVPLFKEDFPLNGTPSEQGGITVMNTTSTCSKVEFDFIYNATTYGITTKQLCEGEAVMVRRISDGNPSNGAWTLDGSTPPDNAKFLVRGEAETSGAEFVALYQASTYDGSPTLDILNYEAIPVD
jgi:hypothetical protein